MPPRNTVGYIFVCASREQAYPIDRPRDQSRSAHSPPAVSTHPTSVILIHVIGGTTPSVHEFSSCPPFYSTTKSCLHSRCVTGKIALLIVNCGSKFTFLRFCSELRNRDDDYFERLLEKRRSALCRVTETKAGEKEEKPRYGRSIKAR